MKYRTVFFLLLGSVNLATGIKEAWSAERVYGHQAPGFEPGRLVVQAEFDTVQTDENYNSRAKPEPILGSNFETQNLYLGFSWDRSHANSLSFGVLAAQSFSDLGGESRDNLDLKALRFGLYYKKLPKLFDGMRLVADFQYSQALISNSSNRLEVSLGDGVSWAMLGLWLLPKPSKTEGFETYLGVYHPFSRLSTNLYYSFKGKKSVKDFKFSAGVQGQSVLLKGDKFSVEQDLFVDRANAGSFHYMGENASYTELLGAVGYEVVPYTVLRLGLSHPIAGRSHSKALRVFLSLNMSFSVTKSGYKFPYIQLDKAESINKVKRQKTRLKNYAEPKK